MTTPYSSLGRRLLPVAFLLTAGLAAWGCNPDLTKPDQVVVKDHPRKNLFYCEALTASAPTPDTVEVGSAFTVDFTITNNYDTTCYNVSTASASGAVSMPAEPAQGGVPFTVLAGGDQNTTDIIAQFVASSSPGTGIAAISAAGLAYDTVQVVVINPPPAPTGLNWDSTYTGLNTYAIGWFNGAMPSGTKAAIEYRVHGTSTWISAGDPTYSSSYILSGLVPSTVYDVRIWNVFGGVASTIDSVQSLVTTHS